MLTRDDHPCLDLYAFTARFARGVGTSWPSLELPALVDRSGPDLEPVEPDTLKTTVRDLLRVGGFKPSGRSKPASEYVQRAIPEGRLGAINAAVDLCNVASMHGGLPISVVDRDALDGALRVGIAEAGASYVFNPSGQVIELAGLLCLFDAQGPCANAVKDSQRTKTTPASTAALYLIWGTTALPGRAEALGAWMQGVLAQAGVDVERVG